MRYTTLGRTGLVVSQLAFGGGSFGVGQTRGGAPHNIGEAEADRITGRLLDAGINLFDCADVYVHGESERILGKVLGKRRKEVVIATKGGGRMGEALLDSGSSYRHLIEAAEASLKRLGTDYIDLYQIHFMDPLTPWEEVLRAFDDLTRRGLVRYCGLSNWPAWRTAMLLAEQDRRAVSLTASLQLHYTLLCRDAEFEHIPLARAAGLGLLVWSPLSGGFLTGKYTRDNPKPEGTRMAAMDFPGANTEAAHRIVDVLREVAGEAGASPAQCALAWLMAKPAVSGILFGVSHEGQLEENLQAAEVTLSEDAIARLDAVSAPTPPFFGFLGGALNDPKLKAALGR